jgi:SAM-dependent methyltransferase
MAPRCIFAAIANMRRMQLSNRLEFVCDNIYNWMPRQQFDVVLSHEAVEHVHDPKSFLQILKHFVKPDEIVGACVQLSVSFARSVTNGCILSNTDSLERSTVFREGNSASET